MSDTPTGDDGDDPWNAAVEQVADVLEPFWLAEKVRRRRGGATEYGHDAIAGAIRPELTELKGDVIRTLAQRDPDATDRIYDRGDEDAAATDDAEPEAEAKADSKPNGGQTLSTLPAGGPDAATPDQPTPGSVDAALASIPSADDLDVDDDAAGFDQRIREYELYWLWTNRMRYLGELLRDSEATVSNADSPLARAYHQAKERKDHFKRSCLDLPGNLPKYRNFAGTPEWDHRKVTLDTGDTMWIHDNFECPATWDDEGDAADVDADADADADDTDDIGAAAATGLQSSLADLGLGDASADDADADDADAVADARRLADRGYRPVETDDHGIITRMRRRDGKGRRTWTEGSREVFRILCDLYDETGDPVMNEQINDHTDYMVSSFISMLKDAGAVEEVGFDDRRALLRPTEAGRKSLKDHADASTHLSEADREEGTFTPGTTYHEILTIVAQAAHEGETPIRSPEVKDRVVDTKPSTVAPAMSTLYKRKCLDHERDTRGKGGVSFGYGITDHGIDQLREHGLYEPEGDA